jgi:hypothetical protein
MAHLADHGRDRLALIGKEHDMPKNCPVEVRPALCGRMLNGEKVQDLADETSISTKR